MFKVYIRQMLGYRIEQRVKMSLEASLPPRKNTIFPKTAPYDIYEKIWGGPSAI